MAIFSIMVGISRIFDYIRPAMPSVIHIIITIVHQTNMHVATISENMFAKGKTLCDFKQFFFVFISTCTYFVHVTYNSELIIAAIVLSKLGSRRNLSVLWSRFNADPAGSFTFSRRRKYLKRTHFCLFRKFYMESVNTSR